MKKWISITLCAAISLVIAGKPALAQTAVSVAKSDSCMIEASKAYNYVQSEKVKENCRKAIEYNARNDAAYYMLAKLAITEAEYLEAERLLKSAADIDSTNYYYLATLGAVYVRNNDIPSAIKLYEYCINRFPSKTDSYSELIELYIPRGQTAKALEVADKLQ